MRVGIIAIQHESNTFIHTPTTLQSFEQGGLRLGGAVREAYAHTHHEVGGFFQALDEAGIEAVPILTANATPSGVIPDETLEHLLTLMHEGLDDAGPLNGLLVAPHGAAVSEKQRDMDGYWLNVLRQRVGPDMPIICTLDPHANISQRMIDACNATIAYRSNPHLDQRQRGLEAGRLMARTLRGEVMPTQAAAMTRVAINIERQFTSAAPCKPMYDLADKQLTRDGVLSNSIILGFPYADVEEMGSAFIVVTDNDPALAKKLAGELAEYLTGHRNEFVGNLIDVDDAIDRALAAEGSVCMLDMGDNVGGGAPADGTIIAHALLKRNLTKSPAFVCIFDPASVKSATAAGVGERINLTVGGKTDPLHGPPLDIACTVVSLHDGRFEEPQARHGGQTRFDMGPTVIVRTDGGLTIQLTSRRAKPFSLNQIISCGLDPKAFKILVAKGTIAPIAAYAPVCDTMLRVNTPGVTCADMVKMTYHHRRKPMFPFEDVA